MYRVPHFRQILFKLVEWFFTTLQTNKNKQINADVNITSWRR